MNNKRIILGLAGLAVIAMASTSAHALEQGDHTFNGFGTLGLTYMGGEADGRGYGINGQIDDQVNGDALTRLGVQASYGVTDDISVTGQLVAKAVQDTWKLSPEWLYGAYRLNDNFTFRAGRLRVPVYMYSEVLDVGYAYPWLSLPNDVYDNIDLTNYEGVDMLYTRETSLGQFNMQIGAGQAENRKSFIYGDMTDIDYKDIRTIGMGLKTDMYGSFNASLSEADVSIAQGKPLAGRFTSLGYQYDDGVWVANAENTDLVIEGPGNDNESFYVMGGRRFGSFLAHVTYGGQVDDDEGKQRSMTYGLNYNVSPTVTLKGEYKHVETTGNYDGSFSKTVDDLKSEGLYKATSGALGSAPTSYDGDIFAIGVSFVF